MKKVGKYFGGLVFAVILVLCCVPNRVQAAGGNLSVSVSSGSVNIGDTITVTVSGSADVAALIQVNVSCSGGAEYIGQGNSAAILEPGANETKSESLSFRATAPGTVTFSASVVQAFGVESQEALSISGASANVTVNNAANEGGNNGGNQEEPSGEEGTAQEPSGEADNTKKSGDNSLKSLVVSPGTLSPSFKYSTTNYKVNVAENVTSIAVDAQTSHSKATVESVSGNTNLQIGENTVKIVVKAENGTIAVYNIVVTRGGAAEGEKEEEPEQEPGEETVEKTDIVIGGKSYTVSAGFPENIQLPEEFEKTTAVYNGEEVETYSFTNAGLTLYYLTEESPAGENPVGGCFFYDETTDVFFPYIKILVGEKYVIVLPVSYNKEGSVPEGYELREIPFDEFVMEGYQLAAAYTENVIGAMEYYLVYGVDTNGMAGWYQYDDLDRSLQRYIALGGAIGIEEETQAFDEEAYQKAFGELSEKYQKEKEKNRNLFSALIVVVVIALIIIVNILIFGGRGKRKRKEKEMIDDMDLIDFEDF